jgi:hypothetical protein
MLSRATAGFNAIRLTVKEGSAAKAQVVLDSAGADYPVLRAKGKVFFLIASPGGAEELAHSYHPDGTVI